MNDKIEATLIERGKQYGDVQQQAEMAETIKSALHSHRNWNGMSPVIRQSLDMIAVKMSRIVCGGPLNSMPDSWDDIAGYAKLPFRKHTDPEA